MASSTLLWIHHDDPTHRSTSESSTVRQHVMVDYHTKKAKRLQGSQIAGKSKSADRRIKHTLARAEHVPVKPPTSSVSTAKQTSRHVACSPPPAPGLINDEHRSVYNAIWWHRYAALSLSNRDAMDWQDKCKVDASETLWRVAQIDRTFFEIFMCLSAAKEVLVKKSSDTRAYYRHKGRAISLLSQAVNRKFSALLEVSQMLMFA